MKSVLSQLSLHGKITYYVAHLFKALTKQHHLEYLPFLKSVISDDSIIIDVGAHAGQFTKLFSKIVPDGRVYAFEPGSYASSILNKVIMVNRLNNVTQINKGLGESIKKECLIMQVKKSGSLGFGLSHLGDGNEDVKNTISETIDITTLDAFAEIEKLEKINFIKADIEGWEMQLLCGAKSIIQKWHPILMLEVNRLFLTRAENTPEELWDFLIENGYEIFRLLYDGKNALQTIPAPEPFDGNIICYPC
ncbi:MAG: FkbM family methyltransferase [Gammaproteobacteria bacterium]|nr:FkbM family methyltransferase [Gammaproteobacteria bacterium]